GSAGDARVVVVRRGGRSRPEGGRRARRRRILDVGDRRRAGRLVTGGVGGPCGVRRRGVVRDVGRVQAGAAEGRRGARGDRAARAVRGRIDVDGRAGLGGAGDARVV